MKHGALGVAFETKPQSSDRSPFVTVPDWNIVPSVQQNQSGTRWVNI